MRPEKAHRVGFVDQHHRAVLLGDGDHFLERRDIAHHRIDAFEHDELARLRRQAAEPLVQIIDRIVAEAHHFGIAHRAPVIDRRVAVGVER